MRRKSRKVSNKNIRYKSNVKVYTFPLFKEWWDEDSSKTIYITAETDKNKSKINK